MYHPKPGELFQYNGEYDKNSRGNQLCFCLTESNNDGKYGKIFYFRAYNFTVGQYQDKVSEYTGYQKV
jgi:hypothetical protein